MNISNYSNMTTIETQYTSKIYFSERSNENEISLYINYQELVFSLEGPYEQFKMHKIFKGTYILA